MLSLALPLASEVSPPDFGLLQTSPLFPWFQRQNLPIYLRLPSADRILRYPIGSRLWSLALPITFTPFASTQPCSARCVFCSETLLHRDSHVLSATLRPPPSYFDGLRRLLSELRGLPLSFSLSGLEATDQAAWLELLLATLQEHENLGGIVEEKILYSNAGGLARETTGSRLLPLLRSFGLTRAEISRHHHSQDKNDAIMRFRRHQPIQRSSVFEQTLRDALSFLHIRLVCVLQASGIATPRDLWDYLAWAEDLGVCDIVFREFSRLGHEYLENQTFRTIASERIDLDALLQTLLFGGLPPGFTLSHLTAGYYFWNLVLTTPRGTTVTFETSDYNEMKSRHRSDVLYKLVYHANGHLCGDWDPQRQIVWTSSSLPPDDELDSLPTLLPSFR